MATKVFLGAFTIGDRVQPHPCTDAWMRGDRYGTVTKLGRIFCTVKMDCSGRSLRLPPDLLTHA